MFAKQAPDEEKHKKVKEAITFLDGFIGNQSYVAGDKLTIADLSIFAGLTFVEIFADYSFGEWKNVSRWMDKLKKELPYHQEINEKPSIEAKESFKQNMKWSHH